MPGVSEFYGGRGYIQDTDGTVRFDTDRRHFHITDRAIDGFEDIAARLVPETGANVDYVNNHVIGSCNDFATHIVGSFMVSGISASGGVPYNKWFDASGTYIHVFSSVGAGNPSADNVAVAQLVHYTFRCSGGVVYLDEAVHGIPVGTGVTVIIPAHTINFRLKAGLFT